MLENLVLPLIGERKNKSDQNIAIFDRSLDLITQL